MRNGLVEAKSGEKTGPIGRPGAARLLILAEDGTLMTGPRLAAARAARKAGYDVVIASPPAASPGHPPHSAEDVELDFREIPPFGAVKGLGKALTLVRAFGTLFDAMKPNLVHCIGLRAVLYGGAAARLRRLPAVLAAPGVDREGAYQDGAERAASALKRFMLRAALGFAAGNAKAEIVIHHANDQLRRLNFRPLQARRPFYMRGAAADLAAFQPRGVGERHDGPPIVMLSADSLGSAELHVMAAATSILSAKGVAVRMVLLGEGDVGRAGRAGHDEIAAYQNAGLLEWWAKPADRGQALRQADLFCSPVAPMGLEDVPRPVIEALATGLPVIASDGPWIRQVVRHGVNGLLVTPGDAQSLAQALERLIADIAFRKTAGERAREIAEAEFSLDAFLTASLVVYRAALDDAALGPCRVTSD